MSEAEPLYWISARPEDRPDLEKIGVKIGGTKATFLWDARNGTHRTFEFTHCEIPSEAFRRIDRLWGYFVWGPEEKSGTAL